MIIVLVDNIENDLSMLKNMLKTLFPNCQVQTFTDPLMSAKYICNNDVSMAFLAAEMRPVDGYILLRTLRANKPLLPVVMLIDNDLQQERALCEATNGCLVKPVSAEMLTEVVAQI